MAKRKGDKSGYTVEGEEYPSVTKIIGWVFNGGKSDRLVPWAVKVTCDYINESVLRVLDLGQGDYDKTLTEIVNDARKEAVELTKEAGWIGEEVHEAISKTWVPAKIRDIKNGTNYANEELGEWVDHTVASAYDAFRKWADKVNLTPIESEMIVYDKKSRYAGTLDLIAMIDTPNGRKLYIIDIKTSNYFYDIPNGCQLGAYHKAYPRCKKLKTNIDGIAVIRLDKSTGKSHFRDYTEKMDEYKATFKMFREIHRMWKEKGGEDG